MKFAKPIVAVMSVSLMATLTACGSEPDTQNLLPNPSTTIGMEIPKPTPTDSSVPGAEISASPEGQSRTDKPISVPEQSLAPVEPNQPLPPNKVDVSTARALYARNLQLIEIATIVKGKTETSEVKAIASSQIKNLETQNSSIGKFLKENNLVLPKAGESVPNPYLSIDIDINPSDIRSLKDRNASMINAAYYTTLRSAIRDLSVAKPELLKVLKNDGKKFLETSDSADKATFEAFEKYRKDALTSGARP